MEYGTSASEVGVGALLADGEEVFDDEEERMRWKQRILIQTHRQARGESRTPDGIGGIDFWIPGICC